MQLMGLPTDQADTFLGWAKALLHTSNAADPDGAIRKDASRTIYRYLGEVIAARRQHPGDERALARQTRQGSLATMQMTQEKIADSWIEIESFRLLVLRTAWLIDKHQDYRNVRKDISAIKAAMPKVMFDVVQRSCICMARSAFPTRCRSRAG